MALGPGTQLHRRYEIVEQIGAGGASQVFKARDLLHRSDVALKVVALERPDLVDAFLQEFTVLRDLFHPHLSRVHDFGRAVVDGDAVAFCTSDIVDGVPVDRFARGRPWPDVRRPLADGLRALALLHRAGIRHGDFKPDNLLVDRAGRGTLIDLGCAVAPPPGTVSGTPGYIAPELLSGAPGDRRADLYAVGVTMHRLAGLARDTPDSVAALAGRLTRDDPAGRPADVDEVLAALGEAPDREAPLALKHPLFDREDALAAATRLLDALLAGTTHPRGLCLCGPEGIGRTRALRECKWLAQPRCRVVEGDARRPDAVIDVLRRAANEPDLRDDLHGAVLAWRKLASLGEPAVLVLDDAHLLAEPQREAFAALLRLLQPADPVALLWTEIRPPTPLPSAAVAVELPPLTEDAVRRLVGSRLPEGRIADVMRVTGGVPGEVRSLLSLVRSGAEDLLGLAGAVHLGDRRSADLRALLAPARRALGFCAALDGRIDPDALAAFDVAAPVLAALHADGWLVPDGPAFRLARFGDAVRIAEALGAEEAARRHAEIAGWLGGRPDRVAERVRHLALGGRPAEAEALLADHAADRAERPQVWRRALDALAAAHPEPSVLLAAAEVREAAGDPRGALEAVAPLVGRELPAEQAAAVLARVGACHLKLGDAAQALRHLDRALDLAPDPATRARIADLICRSRIQSGACEAAAELARRALAWAPEDEALAGDLREDLGVASSYLGRAEEARENLAVAERIAAGRGLPRAQVRTLSYRAIHEYRLGNVRAAAECYARALETAERHGLADLAATAALNVGTALHRRGEWGAALESYERGLAMAVALGKVRTEAALRFDLAQLHCDVGRFDRAGQCLAEARARAEEGGIDFFVAAAEFLAGEILMWQGRHGEARERLSRGRALLEAHGAPREAADVDIHMAELALAAGDPGEADARLSAAGDAAERSGAEDLRTRVLLLRGRVELARERGARALQLLEEARPRAAEHEERDLEAEIESWLAAACERQGADRAATRHRERALEIWDRCAATLPPHLRDGVWSHPRRAHVPRAAPPSAGPSSRERKLERLLAINARLNSSLDAKRVLEFTMDAAVELTRAERGFLLLAPRPGDAGSKLRAAVARNIDREAVGRAAMKFSRSIAERVVASGEPVLTAEAQADDRFAGTRSVQAMGLVSVLCVPIRGRDGVLGALYVDNRFQRGRFDKEDLEILLGFADQAGIALTNARLLADLDARTRQLEEERKRIAASLEDRSREVDRLAEQVRQTQRALHHRYDYSGIVGRGAAMQNVFAVLDRVTASTLSVLVEGESGTGKELVARAIHANGPRRDGPFVGVNCGALTETLLESELFGHVRGAFTGADRDRVGLFVEASRGTLFLDEVGEMPPSMQVKLLRALEEGEIRPVGSTAAQKVAPRIVCATNRRLAAEVEAGRFREDLFYRLAVVQIVVPPLRERPEDVADLARHLLRRLAEEHKRPVPALSLEALRKLLGYDWPGNVRQLENVLSQAIVFSTGDTIGAEEILLPAPSRGSRREGHREFQAREAAEIAAALAATRWNVSAVCRKLGIARTSLYRKLRRYGLARGRRKGGEE